MIVTQVNRLLIKQQLNILRHVHRKQASSLSNTLCPLKCRKLVKISGNDASVFLQGLITNDMRHFEEGAKSMYAMFLNNKGRVLFDTLIYKWEDENTYMVECDKDVLVLLQKHLKLYKLKRLINIEDVSTEIKIWVLLTASDLCDLELITKNKISIYKDPRIGELGCRILANSSLISGDIVESIGCHVSVSNSEEEYKYQRYKLGVSEGSEDLPPGSSFPLEVNCDYLHGVSFHKGCYIGQEMTARVHHTGVVRKRVMPVKLIQPIKEQIEKDSVIIANNNPKSNVGKLKGYISDYGIGLIRIKEALEATCLTVNGNKIEVVRPNWWPIEAPKEKTVIMKNE